jgi:predicted SAM-dependent methyltransferase
MSETLGCKERRLKEGFFEKYINGSGIDIGCGRLYGYSDDIRVHQSAIAHDKDMCDAHLMDIFEDNKFDYVYSSHVLEHLEDPIKAIKNWFRICKPQGYIIISVPSKYRYEKKDSPPSRWNADHKRFYTISNFANEIEEALKPNTYTIEYIKDCYNNFNWDIPDQEHSSGEYQLECVIKKRKDG